MTEKWRGIFKLGEELGELQQLLGKAGPFPSGPHPDCKGSIRSRLPEEIADVYAALDYFVSKNRLPLRKIERRRRMKVRKFTKWGLSGLGEIQK